MPAYWRGVLPAAMAALLLSLVASPARAGRVAAGGFEVRYQRERLLATRVAQWADQAARGVQQTLGIQRPRPLPAGKRITIELRDTGGWRSPRAIPGRFNHHYAPDAASYSYLRRVIVLRLQRDPFGLPLARRSLREAVARALLHHHGLQARGNTPCWFQEGLSSWLGECLDRKGEHATRRLYLLPLVEAREQGRLLALRKLLGYPAGSLVQQSGFSRLALRAQFWALVRRLVDSAGNDRKRREVLCNLVRHPAAAAGRLLGELQSAGGDGQGAWEVYLDDLTRSALDPVGRAQTVLPPVDQGAAHRLQALLRSHLHDDTATRQQAIADAFGGADPAYGPLLEPRLGEANRRVRAMAAQACGILGWRAALPALARLALEDGSSSVRAAAAVGRLNYHVAPRRFLDALRSQRLGNIRRAAAALERVADPVAVDVLIRYTTYEFRSGNFPNVWMQHGTSTAYVSGYQQGAGGSFEPVVDNIDQGTQFQHKVISVHGTHTVAEVITTLRHLTGQAAPATPAQWRAWHRQHRGP